MPKIRGKDIYVEVNTGTEQTPVWTKVGGATDASIDMSGEGIDVTDKDSEGWAESLIGIKSVEVSSEHFMLDSDVGYSELEDAYLNDTLLDLRFTVAASKFFRGKFRVSKLSIKGPLKEAGTVSVSFSLSGPLSTT
ncbi:MAG: phage major tail protein, TP901-1 family [Clostridiales bacterium]|jgi:TP901-1 family phage major tail protein|nr:phage major tail protein, TP901-1 family [Clostridiales bacterium]